ncbi:flagellar protein [Paenibacillus cremeus]|uniref:Flagellar protein n=1 Tax=Paenibacillus cremeus TaxID=2163881 RepID=A0A559KHD7_9BACL|nr:flagellar protein [Paenibacillus cremeus]TVY11543.1 flagellar protein [Paenibacillus cremeus]
MTMLMVSNCPKCGKVYQKNVRNMCQECIRSFDNELDQCLNYLRDHRKATTEELSEGTGVKVSQIVSFIKESRLLLMSYPNLTYPCNSCNSPIRQHNLCATCRIRIVSDVNEMKEKEAKAKERGIGFQIRDRFQR